MALMLPGTGAALDKEQAQLDTVVVAHGFRPPLPPAPPSFVPMVTPPAPIGYVEGHRPLFLLDTSSKTMARKGRMGLMRDVLTALVQPGGEVRDSALLSCLLPRCTDPVHVSGPSAWVQHALVSSRDVVERQLL